jgi:hypothetical protein
MGVHDCLMTDDSYDIVNPQMLPRMQILVETFNFANFTVGKGMYFFSLVQEWQIMEKSRPF